MILLPVWRSLYEEEESEQTIQDPLMKVREGILSPYLPQKTIFMPSNLADCFQSHGTPAAVFRATADEVWESI